MIKILLLPAYHYPEQAASLYIWDNLWETFSREGYVMELHVPSPSRGVSKGIREEFKKRRKEILLRDHLYVNRFWMFGEGKNPGLRLLRYLLCTIIQFYLGVRAKQVNVLYVASTPPTQGAMFALLKKIKRVPFIYNLQDIFPDSLVTTGLTRQGSLLWKIGRVIEDFTYRHADKIIVISEDFKRNIMAKGVQESKIEVIYNWVDENAVIDVDRKQNVLFDRYGLPRDKFYITYSGNIGLTQNMDLLLEVAGMLKEKPQIHFVLIGEGAYKQEVEKQIKEKRLDNISLLPFQPYEEISHVFSLGDVGLVISKLGVGVNSVPSKTWSILSACRPVLASFDEGSELHRIIENNKVGVFAPAGDKQALYKAIIDLHRQPESCRQYGQNGRSFILQNLTRKIGTSKYIEVIKSVVDKLALEKK